MKIMNSIFGLRLMVFSIFVMTSARNIKPNCKYLLEKGGIFNGKTSITLSEYAQNIEKAVGYKLNQNLLKLLEIDFKMNDKNNDGHVDLQEAVAEKLDREG